ncbi:S1C family serine protease [Sharpea azabuensis]|uniref:Serine protease Do n=1 Tax=Sharpea azabuensis TaxID=322505 RepID=A0A1H6VM56_9FIRM|nr:trypsin-like peptidase domain-containing protein [Sharpea azabuensis]SEJ05701.1 serine protease Do [Sharpea azabuensis]
MNENNSNNMNQVKKRGIGSAFIIILLVLVLCFGAGAGGAYVVLKLNGASVITTTSSTPATTTSSSKKDASNIAKKMTDSVVAITTEAMTTSNFWFGSQVVSGAGSGVIMSSDGYIITNAHVVNGASTIKVTTSDEKTYTAKLVGKYTQGDIAVIKINATGLSAATFGDSDKITQGQTAYAVGNPEGTFSGSITSGIVSALNRTITVSIDDSSSDGENNQYSQYFGRTQNTSTTAKLNVIQTDAAVSPGNSGGGLFDSNGTLIGIVNAKSSDTNSEGLGFAIPVNTALKIAKSLISKGSYSA